MANIHAATWPGIALLLLASDGAGSGSLGPLVANPECAENPGSYFDPVTQRCSDCDDLDPDATRDPANGPGSASCTCNPGLVECRGGQRCFAEEEFMPARERSLECRACPVINGQPTAPTQDRTRCMPCDPEHTLQYSQAEADCLCPPGEVLVERGDDGAYFQAKRCVRCATDAFPGPAGEALALYDCRPCPDEVRMYRDAATGECRCRDPYVRAATQCVERDDATLVTDKFPESEAVNVIFRDLIDGGHGWWECGPFGTHLGIELKYCKGTRDYQTMDLNDARQIARVESSMIKWLYVRCAVGCLHRNTTACQCVSNLCVLVLYEDEATVCRFLRDAYEGRGYLKQSQQAYGVRGMPWIFYAVQTPRLIMQDTSIDWKFTMKSDNFGGPGITNRLYFWLAKYALEGAWLGWERLGSQLDLCAQLGGTSTSPLSPPTAWRRFGSSVLTSCRISLKTLQRCGAEPVLYELFATTTDGELVPVPVRILNIVRRGQRPNLNRKPEDPDNDELVRRFVLCDAVTGIQGQEEAYLSRSVEPTVFRWAAHMAMQVRLRPDVEGQIYVPVLSLAYAEKRTANLDESASTDVSFKPEYSMDTEYYWEVMTWFIVIISICAVLLAVFRMYLVEQRYPSMPQIAAVVDTGLFVPKIISHALVFFSTVTSMLFWFHFAMAAYWFVIFKAQDAPKVLLPTAFEGDQYEPHDILLVLVICMAFICLCLDLFKHLKVFVFLVDWEKGLQPRGAGQPWRPPQSQQQEQLLQQQQQQQAYLLGAGYGAGPQVFGAPQGGPGVIGARPSTLTEASDSGVSAWRSLFVCNELNERLSSTRTASYITWGLMAVFLEGCGWKNAARWYPRFAGNEGMLTASFNPFLQFALGALVWMYVLALELIVKRVLSIKFGDGLNDFVDICSVANVSVLFLDEPFHGFYLHGKAASSRGDWSHSELCKVMGDEDKGIGFNRGLTNRGLGQSDACQTFEVFLPPNMSVQVPQLGQIHFGTKILEIFAEVQQIEASIASRVDTKGTPRTEDRILLAKCRCELQAMVDALIHAVMQATDDVVQPRPSFDWFWGSPPSGGVQGLRQPTFFRDQNGPAAPNGLAWTSVLAYGNELRLLGVGFPTGFEWHLILLEFLLFSLTWRFHGSTYLGMGIAFCVNQIVIRLYRILGRRRLAHTALIDKMFLI